MKKLIYGVVSVVAVFSLTCSLFAKDEPKLDPSKLPPASDKTGLAFDPDYHPNQTLPVKQLQTA